MTNTAYTDKVIIFDTTLRDGEQSAGAGLTVEEKLRIAHQLKALKVDVIEAGFAGSSHGDFQAVKRVAEEVKGPIVCSLARAVKSDIDAAGAALKNADNPRIHTFISSSEIHLMHQMRKDRETVMNMAVEAVRHAKSYVKDVEFSPMDATRTEPEYLYIMLEKAIEAGATTVNIPDTVGYSYPEEFGHLIKGIFENVPNIGKAVVSVHCHNDLGMAVANSLSAVESGARQIETCVNGLGERAGNAALEEVAMALKIRTERYKVSTNVVSEELGPASRLVANIFGFPVQFNKAITGQNAFRHSSGIHQDGYLKSHSTFEIMTPQSVGWRGDALVLGKLSGRAGLRARMKELGYNLTSEELADVFSDFKKLADNKREITDADLEALMEERRREADTEKVYELDNVHVVTGTDVVPTATVTLKAANGDKMSATVEANGPVAASLDAVKEIVQMDLKLTEFVISAISEGVDALGDVTIRIQKGGSVYSGRGFDKDIIVASVKAYLNAINRALIMNDRVGRIHQENT